MKNKQTKQTKQTRYYRNTDGKRRTAPSKKEGTQVPEQKVGIAQRLWAHFQSEREKLAPFSRKKKIEYILEYYWLWILGIAVAIFLPSYVVFRAVTTVKDYNFFIVYANTFQELGNGSQLWKDYVDYADYDLKKGNVMFQNSCYFDPSKSGGTNNSYYQVFVAYVESGDLDAVTMERESLEALGKSGRLLDLEDESCSSILEKYGDRLVYAEPYDEEYEKDLVPIGIDISDSILMTKYHIYEDNCVLGISSDSSRIEEVERFLEYILEET